MSAKYIDLLISNDDLTPDAGGIPEKIADRASIAQDLVHMIRESGLLTEMLANRDAGARRLNMIKVTLAVAADERIVPGTAAITETSLGTYPLKAATVDYGPLSMTSAALAWRSNTITFSTSRCRRRAYRSRKPP